MMRRRRVGTTAPASRLVLSTVSMGVVLLAVVVIAVVLIAAAPGAAAGPVVAAEPGDRAQVIERYRSVLEPLLRIPTGFSGNVAGCDPGTISQANADATLAAVNYVRGLAQLPPVVLNLRRSAEAQASALIMAANGSLTHAPEKDARCWTKAGYDGASHGNLSLGWSDPPAAVLQSTGPRAVLGYLEDPGASNDFAGHRRWLLWQGLAEIGTGDTDVSNTIVVIPEDFAAHRGTAWVPWPSAGAFPRELEPSGRWSLSYPNADFSRARIKMTGPDGTSIKARVNPIRSGYADNTIVWEAALPSSYRVAPDVDYPVTVTVSGVRLPGGKVVKRTWTTTLVRATSGPSLRARPGGLEAVLVRR
jgi:uncharacterized protein YkwD